VEPRFRTRRIELAFDRRTECDRVLADEGQLRGAFLNLFLNAIDAMPDGGRLEVWTECAPDGAGGIEARVHIVDSGQGVRTEIRGLIFEPFFTTKPGGSGIGLSMTAQTVAAHGGRLVLANAPDDGGGAHFEVRLPAGPAGADANDGAGLDDDPGAKPKGGPRRPATRLMERTEG